MIIFTPDTEPYLGRQSVFQFDKMILCAMEQNKKIAPWTHGKDLNPLQRAGTELIPHGFSIALSIRELVRQGYLISSEILLRPLIERAAVISYLAETPSALPLWENGWPHRSRPPLYKLLAAMHGAKEDINNAEDLARQVTQHFNSLVHADPQGSRYQSTKDSNHQHCYTASKSLFDIDKCDTICFQATMYLIILTARAVEIFPQSSKQNN